MKQTQQTQEKEIGKYCLRMVDQRKGHGVGVRALDFQIADAEIGC
jgi:hypothetical protein